MKEGHRAVSLNVSKHRHYGMFRKKRNKKQQSFVVGCTSSATILLFSPNSWFHIEKRTVSTECRYRVSRGSSRTRENNKTGAVTSTVTDRAVE